MSQTRTDGLEGRRREERVGELGKVGGNKRRMTEGRGGRGGGRVRRTGKAASATARRSDSRGGGEVEEGGGAGGGGGGGGGEAGGWKQGTLVGLVAGGQEREEGFGERENVARCKQGLTN